MKYLIIALIAVTAASAFADVKELTWLGNNPAGTVNYVLEINRSNPADETKWQVLVVVQEENYQYDEQTFGRTYYRVWAETLNADPETGKPIRSVNSSNVVSTVIRPNAPAGLGAQ